MAKDILIFSVAGRQYGIGVKELQSIENYIPPTSVSNGPELIPGIVSMRDEIYPVIDLHCKFSMPKAEVTEETKYLLINTNAGKAACMVDSVIEIYKSDQEQVKPFPSMLRTKGTEYADCIIQAHDKLVLVISPENLFTDEEAKEVTSVIEENIEE